MLPNWNKNNILKFSIDHNKVSDNLTDFPVLLNLTDESGVNDFDCSDVFDKLNYTESVNDDFTGDNWEEPNSNLWHLSDGPSSNTSFGIYGNKLRYYRPNNIADTVAYNTIYTIHDDLDIQIDWSTDINTKTNRLNIYLMVYDATNISKNVIIRLHRYSSNSQWVIDKDWNYIYYGTWSSTNSKFRITRSNNNWNFYTWDGSWTARHTNFNYPLNRIVKVMLRVSAETGYPTVNAYFDNFKVNSGTIVWPLNTLPNRKKIAAVYPAIQKHWVDYVDDYFTGNNNDTPNANLWETNKDVYGDNKEQGEIYVYNNKLKFALVTAPKDRGNISSVYYLNGDCSIQIKVDNTDNTNCNFEALYLWKNEANRCLIGIHYTDNEIIYNSSIDNVWAGEVSVSESSLDHIILKIERISSKVYFYYSKDNENFTRVGYYNFITDPVFIVFRADTLDATTTDDTVYVDYFNLNYGTIDWNGNTHITKLIEYDNGSSEQMYCEIERWDQTNKSAQLWVKVPKILYNQPTDILLYYDKTQDYNTSYIGDIKDIQAKKVWDSSYVAVYHMSQDPSGGTNCILDSTSNANHGSTEGSMTSSDLVDGVIGKAINFDGSDDRVNIPDVINLTRFTLEGFIKTSSDPALMISRGANGESIETNVLQFYNKNGNKHHFFENGEGTNHSSDINVPENLLNNSWQYIADSRINDYWTTYTESYYKKIDTSATPETTAATYIADDGQSHWFNGSIREVRVSNINRSVAWIKATSYSASDKLATIDKADIYYYTGTVSQKDVPVQRNVFIYDRTSGELIDKCVSTTSGTYYLTTTVSGEHNVICYAAENYQDVILGKVLPNELG